MTPVEVTIDVLGDDGQVSQVTRTLWDRRWGPVINAPILGWDELYAVTLTDANRNNVATLGAWFGRTRAGGMDDFQAAQRDIGGIPWVRTMAVDAAGKAFYIDSSTVPNWSAKAKACLPRLAHRIASGCTLRRKRRADHRRQQPHLRVGPRRRCVDARCHPLRQDAQAGTRRLCLQFQDGGPYAQATMTYTQSDDSTSQHLDEPTLLYSTSSSRDGLFDESAVSADVQEQVSLTLNGAVQRFPPAVLSQSPSVSGAAKGAPTNTVCGSWRLWSCA